MNTFMSMWQPVICVSVLGGVFVCLCVCLCLCVGGGVAKNQLTIRKMFQGAIQKTDSKYQTFK